MKLFEMEGFLRGKCIPRDLKVNETNAEYLVRKFAEADAMCAALAAENAGLKAAIETHKHGFVRCNCCGDELMCHTDDVCRALDETQATDSFLAEVRAQGVDIAIAELNQLAERSEKEAPIAAEHHRSAAMYLRLFAAKLRREAAQ
ncbi:hypothetical protein [Enterobacter roggenkampii]|uniref:hypothetical protein n=1 Tax=Enterobacter roggenkampii TaxID=1812935 RepID=UPI00244C0E24|nr:hypothetical protein [Enterobacter roggenkampii]MDG9955342.1 hypothetical protein [Enterobacter roggenkampii]